MSAVTSRKLANRSCLDAMPLTYSIQLIDEDDTGCLLPGFCKQLAHSGSPSAHKELHELAGRGRKEGHSSFACYSFGCNTTQYKSGAETASKCARQLQPMGEAAKKGTPASPAAALAATPHTTIH